MLVTKQPLPSSDFVEGEYLELGITLEKAGKLWKALCPFPEHADSSPSFIVYPDGGYHCFGCGAHGSLEDLYELFDKDFRYHVSRIDLTNVRDTYRVFLETLHKNLEKRISKLVKDKPVALVFPTYDKFDRVWLSVDANGVSRLQLAIEIKRQFNKLIECLGGGR